MQEALRDYNHDNNRSGTVDQQSTTATTINHVYGFDHNYVVDHDDADDGLALVAVLQHPATGRRLTVRSTQPGVQLYTGNFLDNLNNNNSCSIQEENDNVSMKDGAIYGRWQGVCLETQHFPDSVLVDATTHAQFAAGKCPILTPHQPRYREQVEYTLEWVQDDIVDDDAADDDDNVTPLEELLLWNGGDDDQRAAWYRRAAEHYDEHCPPTLDGVLGGFAALSDVDLRGSRQFLRDLQLLRPAVRTWAAPTRATGPHSPKYRACECGAGLGRVTKGLLLESQATGLSSCDLVESSSRLLAAAPEYLGDALAARCRFFCVGLQEWVPPPKTYAVIWIQWVLSYLTDHDIVTFLRRCGESLAVDTTSALIVLKENVCTGEDYEVDHQDASVTRSLRYWKRLIRQAGLRVVYEKMQDGLPNDIYSVPMLALEVAPS